MIMKETIKDSEKCRSYQSW